VTGERPSLREKALQWLLRALPAEFRGDFADSIAADLKERSAEKGGTEIWRREIPALAGLAFREHLNVLREDARYALRLMARTPAFTALAVTMLALGTGANIAIFTVIDAVMLRSPFPDPEELAMVRVLDHDGRPTALVPAEQFEALAAAPRSLAAVAFFGSGPHLLTGVGEPRRPDFECVTASMFDVLGTRPFLGRTFGRDEDRPGVAPTIVLSFPFWQQLGRPAIGSVLRLNENAVTVIGVMPSGFAGPLSRSDVSGWLPLNLRLSGNGLTGCRAGVNVFARVRRHLSFREAEASLPGITLTSLTEQTFDWLRTPFLVLVAAVACVLLIACLNVGGLQLERAVARRREVALRMALGASRSRIIRQTLTEHLLMAMTGAAAGVIATVLTLRGVISLLPTNIPHLAEIEVNHRVLFAALVVAAISGFVSSILPMLQNREVHPAKHLVDGSRTTTPGSTWTRRGLVVAQIALSIVVLIGAGLMIQTFLTLRPSEPGFNPQGKLITLIRLPGQTPEGSARFFERLFDRVRGIPGVRNVSGTSYLPMMGVVSITPVAIDDKSVNAFGAVITPEYLSQIKIRIVAGRAFTASDSENSAPVAIVNELLAQRLRPGGAVLGQMVLAPGPRRPGERPIQRQIVGVIANTRSSGADTLPAAEFYVPYAQSPVPLLYLITDADDRRGMVPTEIRRAIRGLDSELVLEDIEPFSDMLDRRVARPRLGAWLLGIFAAIALLLSAVGLMTAMGWWVSQRVHELGIRIALGASRVEVTRMVLGQGVTLVGAGIIIGCLAAAGVTHYLQGWIYGVTPLDTATFVAAAFLMFVPACGAMCLPLWRAISVDPVVVLRAE
jgi:putative ABC transport system permease protein